MESKVCSGCHINKPASEYHKQLRRGQHVLRSRCKACRCPGRPSPEARFWKYVTKSDGCWVWSGAKNGSGYGTIGIRRGYDRQVPMLTHRFSWELHHGPIPEGLWVLHRCDNPPCCNPAHLFLGTPMDNTRDMYSKGRGRAPTKGESHAMAKLSDEDVRSILRASESSGVELAARFGVSPTTIGYIRKRRTWRHI